MYELCKTYFYDNYQVKNIIRLITLCYPCENYIVNPELMSISSKKLSRLSSEEETGTSHILLLMSTHILIITVLSWCKALMNSMVHTRI